MSGQTPQPSQEKKLTFTLEDRKDPVTAEEFNDLLKEAEIDFDTANKRYREIEEEVREIKLKLEDATGRLLMAGNKRFETYGKAEYRRRQAIIINKNLRIGELENALQAASPSSGSSGSTAASSGSTAAAAQNKHSKKSGKHPQSIAEASREEEDEDSSSGSRVEVLSDKPKSSKK